MVGLIQLALGLFKLGWITKFVSNSVIVGLITGVSILIILGQLGDLTGYSSGYSNKVVKTVDLVLHLNEISWTTLAVGLVTMGLILPLGRTPVSEQVRLGAGVRRGDRRRGPARAGGAVGQRRRRDPVGAARVPSSPTSPRRWISSSRRSRSPGSA